MMTSNKTAWSLGTLLILCTQTVAWHERALPDDVTMVFWIAPTMAAFITAFYAPQWKILLGTSLAVLNAILTTFANTILVMTGKGSDFSGFNGTLILFMLTLFFGGLLCLSGAVLASVICDWLKETQH